MMNRARKISLPCFCNFIDEYVMVFLEELSCRWTASYCAAHQLRETALRCMADRLDRKTRGRNGAERRLKEHILICLSGAPSNARVIRNAARMVEAFRADFTAVFVQPLSPAKDIPPKSENRLSDNMHLAEELGARVVTLQGNNIPELIAEYARVSAVSRIVVGRSPSEGAVLSKKDTG